MTDTYEQNLQGLLELIQGARWPSSKGLWSHKTGTPDQQRLHEACLELERREHLYRHADKACGTAWMPVEPHRVAEET